MIGTTPSLARSSKNRLGEYRKYSSFTAYFIDMELVRQIPDGELGKVMRAVRKGDEKARQRLIEGNLRLVYHVVKDYKDMGIELLDLISEGNIALADAVDKVKSGEYKKRKGKFSTFASKHVWNHTLRVLCDKSRLIRLPGHVYNKFRKINKVYSRLYSILEREPTDEEISFETKLSVRIIRNVRRTIPSVINLDAPIRSIFDGNSDCNTIADMIPCDNCVRPVELLIENEGLDILQKSINRLSDKEIFILNARLGLNGNKVRTLSHVGKHFRLSRERVRQIEGDALKKLRKLFFAESSKNEFLLKSLTCKEKR